MENLDGVINAVVDFIGMVVYYLPEVLSKVAHEYVDLGLGMTPEQIADCFAGSEVLGIFVLLYMLFMRKAAPAETPSNEPSDTDGE